MIRAKSRLALALAALSLLGLSSARRAPKPGKGKEEEEDCPEAKALVQPYLKTTFALDTTEGFFLQPLTVDEAEADGWLEISDCGEFAAPAFPGRRFARSEDDDDIVLIFDVNGIVAGFQSVVDKKLTDNAVFNFTASRFYQEDVFFGQDVSRKTNLALTFS